MCQTLMYSALMLLNFLRFLHAQEPANYQAVVGYTRM